MDKRKNEFILRWSKRYRLVQDLGGKCENCGETNIFKLDFHHKDPKEKEFGISQMSGHADYNVVKLEADKCILLCRNCHTELHLKDVEEKFNEYYDLIIEKSKIVDTISRPKLDDDYIYQLLLKKTSLNVIAKILNKDVSTIRLIALRLENKYGEKLFLSREEYNADKQKINKEELIVMYNNGINGADIAKHFGASKSTVYPLIRKLKRQEII